MNAEIPDDMIHVPLTKQMLLDCGWEEHGNILVLKDKVRFGWYPMTGKLIVGYTDVPFPVRYAHELQAFLDAFYVKQALAAYAYPVMKRYNEVLQAAQHAVGRQLSSSRERDNVLIRVFTAYQLRSEGYSFEAIGKCMGYNHTVIIHYVRKRMDAMLSLPRIYRRELEMFNKMKEILDDEDSR